MNCGSMKNKQQDVNDKSQPTVLMCSSGGKYLFQNTVDYLLIPELNDTSPVPARMGSRYEDIPDVCIIFN